MTNHRWDDASMMYEYQVSVSGVKLLELPRCKSRTTRNESQQITYYCLQWQNPQKILNGWLKKWALDLSLGLIAMRIPADNWLLSTDTTYLKFLTSQNCKYKTKSLTRLNYSKLSYWLSFPNPQWILIYIFSWCFSSHSGSYVFMNWWNVNFSLENEVLVAR